MSQQNLAGKVIVLTGASSGFGRGAALAFAKAGASLVLAARSVDSLNEVATECKAAGARTLVVPTDVTTRKQWKPSRRQLFLNMAASMSG
jgi:NADP-dependent 3-hydroxy acid dehydrogenase YdfG